MAKSQEFSIVISQLRSLDGSSYDVFLSSKYGADAGTFFLTETQPNAEAFAEKLRAAIVEHTPQDECSIEINYYNGD
jgi:hypothetical protein